MNDDITSALTSDPLNFLSRLVARSLRLGVLEARSVLARFPPDVLMAHCHSPEHRADVIAALTGMARGLAVDLEESVAEALLTKAMSSLRETQPERVVWAYTPDNLVRYFPERDVWSLLFESRWPETSTPAARALMAGALRDVLTMRLLERPDRGIHTALEMVRLIGCTEIAKALPPEGVGTLLEQALLSGEGFATAADGRVMPFTGERLLALLPVEELAQRVRTSALESVLQSVAVRNNWTVDATEPAKRSMVTGKFKALSAVPLAPSPSAPPTPPMAAPPPLQARPSEPTAPPPTPPSPRPPSPPPPSARPVVPAPPAAKPAAPPPPLPPRAPAQVRGPIPPMPDLPASESATRRPGERKTGGPRVPMPPGASGPGRRGSGEG